MSTKNKYARKVALLRETLTKEFVQQSLAYNQYGQPRPGLLDMRGSGVDYNNYPVFCVTGMHLVVEMDKKGTLGWYSIHNMSLEQLAHYLDLIYEWSDSKRIVKYDPFRSGEALNEHVRDCIEQRH